MPQLSGPGWLAATGATLLLVAAVVVVAGQWAAIGPQARFAGLVGALVAVYFAAEAARDRIPTTATSLAVLAACVTAPVGIAAAAALDGRWPLNIAVGGGAALLACELQSRRWSVRTLKAATVGATVLLAGGLAVLLDVPAALLGAIASVIALAAGAQRRSVVLAALVPFVPALWVLAQVDIGPGVLERMGVVAIDGWVVPVSSLIAGIALAISAQRSQRADIAATAIAVLTYAGISTLIESAQPVSIWLSIPGGVATFIGIVALGSDRSIFSRWARQSRTVVTALLATASSFAPGVVVLLRLMTDSPGPALGGELLLPGAVALSALVLLAVTVDHDAVIDDLVRLGCVAGGIAVVAAADLGIVWVAIASLGGWAITSALTTWRSWIATSSLHAVWAVVAGVAAQATPALTSTIIVAATAIVIVACLSSHDSTLANTLIPVAVGLCVVLLAAQWPDDLAALAALLATVAAITTGVAMSRPGFSPIDALALSSGCGAAIIALFSDAAGVSLGITLISAQLWLYGVSFRRTEVASGAAMVGALALVSLWWTSGTNDLMIDWIAPFGADGEDLALGATAGALLVGGSALRRVQQLSTWLAYGPGSSLALSWLLVAQSDQDADWATFAGLVLGVVAVGIGGSRRLAAPLVIGTVGLIATGIVSVGDRLSSAPTWTWIAVGGLGLLIVAALLERSERPLLPTTPTNDEDPIESVTEVFNRTFQ